jgi:hypothetical protein
MVWTIPKWVVYCCFNRITTKSTAHIAGILICDQHRRVSQRMPSTTTARSSALALSGKVGMISELSVAYFFVMYILYISIYRIPAFEMPLYFYMQWGVLIWGAWAHAFWVYWVYTIWLFNIAMDNGPFIDDFPIKTSIYKGEWIAMLNNQMVWDSSFHDWSASSHLSSQTQISSWVQPFVLTEMYWDATHVHRNFGQTQ